MSSGDPSRLGAYELTGRLGEGAQGVVYLGRDPDGRQVAVKLMHARLSGDSAARSRFVRELEVVEQVAGFCTAQLLDADIEGDQPYIVSEYVPGPSLREQVEKTGPLDSNALIRLAIGTCTALAAIHQAGVVHRDFKPANVLMGPDGPRVIDFGIARALSSTSVTLSSQVVGTPAFMAPEQVAAGVTGPYTDMFAWAGTMLYAATGRTPFGGESIPHVMHQVLHEQVDLSALPELLVGPAADCLTKDPALRPTASDVLMRLLGQVGVSGPSDDPPVPRRRNLKVPLLAVGGAVMAATLGAVAFAFIPWGGAAGKPEPVRIAFMGSITGDTTSLDTAMHEGATLAVQDYNATNPRVPIELVSMDTRSRLDQAAAVAQQIVDGKFDGVIGPGSPGEALQAGGTLDRARIPMISASAPGVSLSRKGWRYWHRMVVGSDRAAADLGNYMVRAGRVKRAVVVEDEQEWSQTTAAAIEPVLRGKGVALTRVQITTTGDFTEGARKIKAASAEHVFYGGDAEPAGLLIKAVHEQGLLLARFYLTGNGLSSLVSARAGADLSAGTIVACACLDPSEIDSGDIGRFRKLYKERFRDKEPGLYSAEGYDAATAFIHAARNGQTTGPDINTYLRSINVEGVTQRIGFTENGDPVEGTSFLYRLQGSGYTLVGNSKTSYFPE